MTQHRDPFIAWLLERAESAGIGNEAGHPYVTVVGALAVTEGLSDPMVSQLSTLLDVPEEEIREKHRQLGYGAELG